MFNNIKIATRLRIFGAAMIVLTLLLVVVGYSMVTRMSSATSEIYSKGLVGSKLLSDGNNAVWELRFGIANYTLANTENRKKILDGRPQFYAKLEDSLNKYAMLGDSTAQNPTLKELLDAFQQYKTGAPKWFELIDADKLQEAAEYRAKVTNAAGSAMVKSIKVLIDTQVKVNEELENSARTSAGRAQDLLIAMGVAAFMVAVASILLMARAISYPLGQIEAEIEQVEKLSDFTRRVTVTGNNEIGHAAEAFNKLMTTVQSSLRQLLDSVDQVSKAAATLSSSSARVASGSSRQSGATAAIAGTIDQVTASINGVSGSARNALDISTGSDELSSRGRDIIQKAVVEVMQIANTMRQTSGVIGELGQQSKQISSVV